jgi:RecA-family ATPase
MKKFLDANGILQRDGVDALRLAIDNTPAEDDLTSATFGEKLPPEPLKTICAANLKGDPPPRRWIVPHWVPSGAVTGLYGEGGSSKTQTALQLQASTALVDTKWLGLPVEQCASLGVYCEDDRDELWRRQADIEQDYEIDRSALRDMHWISRVDHDNLLMTFRRGVGEVTPFYGQVREAALDLKARFVVLDPVSLLYGGNEIFRGEVAQFVAALGGIASAIGGAVLVCAHPSRAGVSSGSGDSGSTGWDAAFRSRLYQSIPKPEAEGGPPDFNARLLERMKANYAARGEQLKLRWRCGVIIRDEPTQKGLTPAGRLAAAADVFLTLLRKLESQNRPVSDSVNAGNYAPRLFAKQPPEERHDYTKKDFETAMHRLFSDGKVTKVEYLRSRTRCWKIAER